ncbi:hypothetical protein RFI_05046 [Reticulomyxa filosa]|uniref:Uncharacterized protein n=1 Tax=Reticulomyxa filosa TaxID=46433 RepID=X6P3C9_RETFI|nr:hypothetical protein RFI_05046 [Reticulomyxa filosa]|eukprot:ETO32072.1 hypothetical protein RFI_05046 [Reticulomyxa filosa]
MKQIFHLINFLETKLKKKIKVQRRAEGARGEEKINSCYFRLTTLTELLFDGIFPPYLYSVTLLSKMEKPQISNDTVKTTPSKKPPKIDDIISEQMAEELQKNFLAEQCEHNLEDIPAEMLLESYMMSQTKENGHNTSLNGENQQAIAEEKDENDPQAMALPDEDYLLAMQLQLEEQDNEEEQQMLKKKDLATTIPATTNKKSRHSNRRKGNKDKIRILPNYYYEDSKATGETEGTTYNDTSNSNYEKVRQVSSGNKMAISGTIHKHDFNEWSTRHVNRLHNYDANLGSDSSFKDVRIGNKAYNSFRRELEKKGFKKFDQPTPADKK